MKVGRFIKGRPGKKILLVSLQKCGTHLIRNVMKEAGFEDVGVGRPCTMSDFEGLKSNQYLISSFTPSDEVQMCLEEGNRQLYIIFNFRDPRDVLVSWFYWLHPGNPKSIHLHHAYMKKVYSHFTDEQLMDIFIRVDKFRDAEYNPLERFKLSRVLYFHPRILNVRFEDLIGSRGGGTDEKQMKTVADIFAYLEMDGIDTQLIAGRVFNKSSVTFRKGTIGDYRNVLSSAQIKLFNELHGDIIRQYGYEPDHIDDQI